MRRLSRVAASASAFVAVSALTFGGCAAIEGLSSITEQACAPNCDGGVSSDGQTLPNEDATQPSDDAPAQTGDDATLAQDTAPPISDDAGEDASLSKDAQGEADASDGSVTSQDAGPQDAGHDAAPPPGDASCGATNTTANCSACGDTCTATNATLPTCSGTTCGYTCNTSYLDCNKATAPDLDGCECYAPGSAQCCANTCPIAHNYDLDLATAVGAFYDCVAAGAYNITVATDACIAYTGNAAQCTSGYYCPAFADGGGDLGDQVCSDGASNCECWTYNGSLVGLVSTGNNTKGACFCPQVGTSPHWN